MIPAGENACASSAAASESVASRAAGRASGAAGSPSGGAPTSRPRTARAARDQLGGCRAGKQHQQPDADQLEAGQRTADPRQEAKDENKESEGNPEMKGRRRQLQREISQGNSVKRVPEADLVVMNPTHYAVALKYDESMPAPQVIAKGADMIALRIRDMAQEHKVPVLQSPMLARALYPHTEID